MTDNTMNVQGYEPLATALQNAYDRAARTKGANRHANGKPFDQQPIMEISRMVGSGFALGQALKKIDESTRMDYASAENELLDAIVYLAAAVNLIREQTTKRNASSKSNTPPTASVNVPIGRTGVSGYVNPKDLWDEINQRRAYH